MHFDAASDRVLARLRKAAIALSVLLCLGSALVGISTARRSAQSDADRLAMVDAKEHAATVSLQMERVRSIVLLASQSPAYADYLSANAVGETKQMATTSNVADVHAGLRHLFELYPVGVTEICFIDQHGVEIARLADGTLVAEAELSLNDRGLGFFRPTMAMPLGQVWQGKPYLSDDTHDWALGTATPIADRAGNPVAMLHYESSIESYRRVLSAQNHGSSLAIIDADSRTVIVDGAGKLATGSTYNRVPAWVTGAADAAVVNDDGNRLAIAPLPVLPFSQNHWVIVTDATPSPIGLADVLNVSTLSLIAGALALLVVALASSGGYRRRLHAAATTDALTLLPNRPAFLHMADQAIAAVGQRPASAVLMIDLDRFKAVNDTLGHHAGDILLSAVGPRLRTVLRDGDLVGRLGGDEFAVLLRGVRRSVDVAAIAERLIEVLNEPFELEGLSMGIEASVGVAMVTDEGRNITDLLKQADIAMYTAKRERANVVFYRPDMEVQSPEKLEMLSELRRAIDHRELVVHYQPKFEIASGLPVGVEALVRWRHPDGRLIPPMDFIPLAEQSPLIHPLTRYVLAESLRQCRAWLDRAWRLPVAVNVSANCFLDRSFADTVQATLAHHRIPAELLTIEITETAIMSDPERVREQLSILRGIGVSVALDDFGVGHSTLGILKSLPIDELKVDRSLVCNLASNPHDAAIVRAVLDLGRSLDLRVVAEGAETGETCDLLMEMGCVVAQGFNWMRPMSAPELDPFLTRVLGELTVLSHD